MPGYLRILRSLWQVHELIGPSVHLYASINVSQLTHNAHYQQQISELDFSSQSKGIISIR